MHYERSLVDASFPVHTFFRLHATTAPCLLGLEEIIHGLIGAFEAKLPKAERRASCSKLRAGLEFGICLKLG